MNVTGYFTQHGLVGWVEGDGTWTPFTFETDRLFEPSDAARLPDGNLMILEHRRTLAEGAAARLKWIGASAFGSSPRIAGEVVAVLAEPLGVGNLEGIASGRGEKGETLLYMVSDDGFKSHEKAAEKRQRTLLLMFELVAKKSR